MREIERLTEEIVGFVVDQLEQVVRAHLQGWRVPGVFAGHQVGPDVQADLAFTLGLLHEFGVRRVSGSRIPEAISAVLRSIDGPQTHTFASYRVAETLARFGTFERNELLAGWSVSERENLAQACDSSEAVSRLNAGRLPRNYAAVLARCELARASLGLIPHDTALGVSLLKQAADLLADNPGGYLDDSHVGDGVYDIYTADLYLFSEPFASRFREVWERGARSALRLVERTVTPQGVAFPWGRSSGALAVCMTIELGGLALREGLTNDPGRWLTLVRTAFYNIPGWFSDVGLISAHQNRSTYNYRGPFRRLQMTFDCLGKLAWAAVALKAATPSVLAEPAHLEVTFPDQDEIVWFDERRKAGVWCYRNRHLSFILPIVGTTLNDYLPAPRNPGFFEVPVEVDLPTGVPVAYVGGTRFVAGHLPAEVVKLDRGLRLRYDGYLQSAQYKNLEVIPRLSGSRIVTYRVERGTLHVEEELQFDKRPMAVALQIAETTDRPLTVLFDCHSPHATTVVDTSGLKEYRSFWAELPRVHQIDFDPAENLKLSYSVTPSLTVLSADHGHSYHRAIYDPLAGRVTDGMPNSLIRQYESTITSKTNGSRRKLISALQRWDLFHLHWPESGTGFGPDVDRHLNLIDMLAAASVRVVWTQHNLVPHSKDERFIPIYEAWAGAAHGVIHHSHWGMEQTLARYRFRPDAIHSVIPHPRLGPLMKTTAGADRARVEAEFGLTPGRLRLGIVGAPRREKKVEMVIEAFGACSRSNLELVVLSLWPDDPIPTHPRVIARRYQYMPRELYDRWLRTIDVLILPFDKEGMLTTGVVGDAVAHGIPALVSDWPFLHETLGDAAVRYGSTFDDLVASLQSLDPETIARAAEAARRLQAVYSPLRAAEHTFEMLVKIKTTRM